MDEIVNLVEEALQSAAADPRKLHELARDQVSPDVAERTQRAVLLAILWAVHNRLEHVRRAGLISQDALKLTERIEKLMATCMHAEQRGSSGSADLATV